MAFDSRETRDAMGAFATGVTVVPAGTAPDFHGMTANAFSSLSLEPPLVLVCVDKSTHMREVLERTGAFTVNILSAAQEEMSTYFATSSRPHGPEELAPFDYAIGETGAPRFRDAICVLDCTVHSVAEGGDHDIYVGQVQAFDFPNDGAPLLFYRGRYRALAAADD